MTVFVDTHVLVYAKDTSETSKQAQAVLWLDHLWETRQGRLSTQVLSELYAVASRKLSDYLPKTEARTYLTSLLAWNPLIVDQRHIASAFRLEDRYGLNYWDALIVAAAEAAGCSHLLTEDLQNNQQLGSVLVINPFLVDPESI